MKDAKRVIHFFNLALVLTVSWALFLYGTSVVGFQLGLFAGFALSTGVLLTTVYTIDKLVKSRRAQRAS